MNHKTKTTASIICCVVLIFWLAFSSCHSIASEFPGWEEVPKILKRIQAPQFPARDFNILTFGAQGDGQSDCTEAFKKAIAASHAAGGGRVIVPAGTFLTGAIHLKSNVNLHLTKNASIRFSQNLDHYLPVVFTRFEGVECWNYSPLIYAFQQQNIAITGAGIVDGQADSAHWWCWTGDARDGWKPGQSHQKADRDTLFQMAENNLPVESRIFGAGHYLRVNFIQLYQCQNILIDSITILRSPMWEVHPVRCENVTIQNLTITTHGRAK